MTPLRAADRPSRPWKNGGGRMADVAVFPAGAGLEDFGWRLSLAWVERDGPFSLFPGMDRVMALVAGEGLVLEGPGISRRLVPDAPPIAYPGDVPIAARRIGGEVVALNAIIRRGAWRAALRHLSLAPGDAPLSLPAGPHVLLLLSGEAVATGAGTVTIGPLDAVLSDTPVSVSATTPSTAWLATFHPAD